MTTAAQITTAIEEIDRALPELQRQAERYALGSLGGGLLSSQAVAGHEANYRHAVDIIADKSRQRARLTHALAEAQRLEADEDI